MCAETPTASLTLPMDAAAPARSRAFLAQAHCHHHAASVLDEAQLLVSELVTNAVRHGSPPITTEVGCRGQAGLHVRVTDGATSEPLVRTPAVDDVGGRGMLLVDLLSSAWGVEPGSTGKAVWFELAPGDPSAR
ncbi:ATP-binding protein [Quadrisphaera sp. INWT6]|uniref:ATP-binding protein n=1 Tax=Quadrisphaera sp. INWT6 TaxID=2596917 RepID=UPI0028162FB9|nr:ATP-binding protein [Quadrisphaera sp. INWT6]